MICATYVVAYCKVSRLPVFSVYGNRKETDMRLQCRGLKKSFGDHEVLKGIDLEIGEGCIFGMLGPSGAGKTTLIKILTGQLGFNDGEVTAFGKNVRDLSGEDKKRFGIMMDSFGLYERFSCGENLEVFADIYGVKKERIKQSLKDVGLDGTYGVGASKLSKGMRARLQLARAFMHDPDVIFLDEPTSGLDPQTSKSIHKLILDKKREGCTIFLTTHNMEEAYELCDEVVLLNEGIIVEKGRPDEICRRYNKGKKIKIHLKEGEDIELAQDAPETPDRICNLMKECKIETIHSSESTLETVFLELTGRKLEEEG